MNVYTILANGFEEIEALTVVDILRRAEINVKTYSLTYKKEVTGAHGIKVISDEIIKNFDEEYNMIFLPGGYPGYVNLESSSELINILHEADKNNKIICAICAAPSILGKNGFLQGKKACCFPSFEKFLIGAEVSYDDVCISDNYFTSRGAGTAHLLGFKIVEYFKGKEFADKLKETMLYK